MGDQPSEADPVKTDPIHPPTSLEWNEYQRLPVYMKDAQAVYLKEKLYVRGLTRDPSEDAKIYIYSFTENAWHNNILDSPTSDSAFITYRDRLVLVGGWYYTTVQTTDSGSGSDTDATTDLGFIPVVTGKLWVLMDEQNWSQSLPPMHTPRVWASAVSVQHNLIVAGGSTTFEQWNGVDVVEVYNGQQWIRALSFPRVYYCMHAAVHDGNCYLVGGDSRSDVFCTTLESLIASAQSKELRRTLPDVPHMVSSITVWGDYLVAMGQGIVSSIDISHFSHTESWIEVGSLPANLESSCAIALPTGELLAIGGGDTLSGASDCGWDGYSDQIFKIRGTGPDNSKGNEMTGEGSRKLTTFAVAEEGESGETKKQKGYSEEEIKPAADINKLEKDMQNQLWISEADNMPPKSKQGQELTVSTLSLPQLLKQKEKQLQQYEMIIQMYKDLHQEDLKKIESVMAENDELKRQTVPINEGALMLAGESIGCLRGVDVIGETSLSVTNEAQTFHWAGYGIKLHIPPASLPAGVGQSSIDIKASLTGKFHLPENTTLVSAVYWIHCLVEFCHPIVVEIQHCATPSDDPSLTFARASQEEPPYKFAALQGGLFQPDSSYACIQLKQFSLTSIIQKLLKSLWPERKYCAQVYYTREAVNTWMADFVITHNLDTCLTAVKEKYSGAVAGPELDVTFEGEEIALTVPREGLMITEWTIFPLAHPGITKEQVDSFKLGQRLPSCKLRIKWNGKGKLAELSHNIELQGAEKPRNYFRIALSIAEGTSSTIRSSRKRRLECEGTEEGETEDEASPSIFKRPRQSMDEESNGGTVSDGSTGASVSAVVHTAIQLDESDHFYITGYLLSLTKDQLTSLGQVLGLRYSSLKSMADSSSTIFLNDMILAWLKEEDDVSTRCPPTWENLVKVLKDGRVGQKGIANTIKKERVE